MPYVKYTQFYDAVGFELFVSLKHKVKKNEKKKRLALRNIFIELRPSNTL